MLFTSLMLQTSDLVQRGRDNVATLATQPSYQSRGLLIVSASLPPLLAFLILLFFQWLQKNTYFVSTKENQKSAFVILLKMLVWGENFNKMSFGGVAIIWSQFLQPQKAKTVHSNNWGSLTPFELLFTKFPFTRIRRDSSVFSSHTLLLTFVLHFNPDLVIDGGIKVEMVLKALSEIRVVLIVLSKTHCRCYNNPL